MPMCILIFNGFASSSFTIVTGNIDVCWAYSYKTSMFIDVTSMVPHMSYYCHTLSIYAKSMCISIHSKFREPSRSLFSSFPALTSSAASHKAQIIKLGHLILHDGRAVPQFTAEVLIIASAYGDNGAVHDLAQCQDLEGNGQRFVGAPVRGQCGADLRERGRGIQKYIYKLRLIILTTWGDPVFTSSPGCSASSTSTVRSIRFSGVR